MREDLFDQICKLNHVSSEKDLRWEIGYRPDRDTGFYTGDIIWPDDDYVASHNNNINDLVGSMIEIASSI